jgi:pyruvate dehydrogenase (quinone)
MMKAARIAASQAMRNAWQLCPALRAWLIALEAESLGLVPFREAIEFPNPDFAALARACGGHGFIARKPNDLMAAIAEALAADGPAIVDRLRGRRRDAEHAAVGHNAMATIKKAVLVVTGG